MSPRSADSCLYCAQGSQTFTVFVTEQPGAEAVEDVVLGQEYLTLAPEDAAALAAELNRAFAAALAPAAGQDTPELFGLRIEARSPPCAPDLQKEQLILCVCIVEAACHFAHPAASSSSTCSFHKIVGNVHFCISPSMPGSAVCLFQTALCVT